MRPSPDGPEKSRVTRRRSREARRRRFMLGGGALLSVVILGAWFPASALLHQHADLTTANAQLSGLHRQDAALAQESKNLENATEIARIAREQYQLVSPGQQAYEVLPPTGAAKASTPYAGDPALSGPVAPSSASVLPPGSETGTTASATASHAHPAHGAAAPQGSATPHGFFSRMVDTLEFWR